MYGGKERNHPPTGGEEGPPVCTVCSTVHTVLYFTDAILSSTVQYAHLALL